MITETCQRWELGREYRRPAGEVIRTDEYDVADMSDDALTAKAFVETHHYSRTCSPLAHPFGLYRHGELSGVAVFGPLPSMNAHRAVFPTLGTKEAVTLGRLVLLDGIPGNGESFFVARCFAMLRTAGIIGVESCADPEPRMSLDGRRIHRGHVGTVYQATSACGESGRYVGRTNPATLRLLPDGTVFSNRASGKVVRGEQGCVYSGDTLVTHGADPLRDGEDPLEWIRRWRPVLTRPMRHRGNLRYLWCLDKRRRAEVMTAPALPYVKLAHLEAARA